MGIRSRTTVDLQQVMINLEKESQNDWRSAEFLPFSDNFAPGLRLGDVGVGVFLGLVPTLSTDR